MNFLIHPIDIQYPIAFYVLELILLFIWVKKSDSKYFQFASFVFKTGYIGMIIAIAAGLFDVDGFGNIKGGVKTHFLAAMSVLIIYTLRALFWRFGKQTDSHYPMTQILFALAGNILVVITAYFGGLLVYGS